MKLSTLLSSWIPETGSDLEITGLQIDSRKVVPGDLFLAFPGTLTDGRHYITQAIEAGASAIAYDPLNWAPPTSNIPLVKIPNLAKNIAAIASEFYQHPTKAMGITGITGTNGKTTIAFLLTQAYELLGKSAAYIGTLGTGKVGAIQPLKNTTPDALTLQQLCAYYYRQGVQQICMEVSSHALDQERVANILFDHALFTNLTHDHLDYHRSMEEYAAAKAKLFSLPDLKTAILNADDPYHAVMSKNISSSCKAVYYGIEKGDIRATNCVLSMRSSQFTIQSPWGNFPVEVQLLGQFNIYNCLAVFCGLYAAGFACEEIIKVLPHLQASPGRMELVCKKPVILVDYAHTPDALENALHTLNQLKKEKIIVVFGCGGDRDKTKRPLMGKIATQLASKVIITNDNPRTENPTQIIQEIVLGTPNPQEILCIEDRKEAIKQAISLAEDDDIILIAGKGHEDYQEIGVVRHHFSDQETAVSLVKPQ